MKTALLALALLFGIEAHAQSMRYRVPPSSATSAVNFGVSGKLTLSGTTGPQIDSTGTSALEIRSNAATGTDGVFRFYADDSITSGNLLRLGEKAGTTEEDRVTVDHQGSMRLWPDGINGASFELFGSINQTNGGADAPLKLRGGINSTAATATLLSAETGAGVRKWSIRGDGAIQFPGVATGSLVACNGSAEGVIQYDTTTKTVKYCNGTAWADL